jgi:hypothetical protein
VVGGDLSFFLRHGETLGEAIGMELVYTFCWNAHTFEETNYYDLKI